MKKNHNNKMPIFLTVAVNCVLLVAVLFLMNYVQQLLHSDTRINLTEVVTQNKDVITSKLMLEVNNLDMIASQIAISLKKAPVLNEESFKNAVSDYAQNSRDQNVFVADKDGNAFFGDGKNLNIAGRRYFRLAMQGKQNISDRLVSRATGDDIFVISVPIYLGNQVVGSVQKPYLPQRMYDICTISLFSSQGYMHIINSDGYIMISSHRTNYSEESDNFFRNIYAQGNQIAAAQVETDVKDNRAGFMEITNGGQKIFSAYTPLEDIHDWYLISSVATDAVSPNANTVVKIFYFILLAIAFVMGGSLFYFLSYKNRQQSNLEQIAFVDSITHGNTYNKFVLQLDETLKKPDDKQYYLLAFDIDNFKYVNSFYGFDFGDQVLRRIYSEISDALSGEELLARVSGDHFVVLLEDASKTRLKELMKPSINEKDVQIYLSAGLYEITDYSESINLMVDKASSAAQMAKGQLPRRIVTYLEEYNKTMIYNEQLKRQMEIALAQREIVPFYQPKVDVDTRKLIGAEALARWRRAEDGRMISPGDFIPLCEKTGQIVNVDFMIFEQVLEFLARNLQNGIACVPISVNFSRVHLLSEVFIHNIIQRLEAHHVPSNLIQVELTESIFFDNTDTITDFVNHMHEHGLLICIDDFGSGYSSLNMLKDIPIDVLKIDRGFLLDTGDPQRQRIILSSIAEMARQLRMDVVVEGVETDDNVALMKEFGCSVAQGYYFARPMDETSFGEIFEKGQVN